MASKIMMPIACAMAMVVLFAGYGAEASIGINWGRESAQRLVPSQVVDLLLQNGIRRARIYTSQRDILAAFAGSGINLTISLMKPTLIKCKEAARVWVQKNHEFFSPCTIRSVYFGGYPFIHGNGNRTFLASIIKAQRWVQEALNERGFEDVKVNIQHLEGELKPNITKPSQAEFKDEIKPELVQYLQFLRENNAPFPADYIPIMDIVDQNFDLNFAFADNSSDLVITDVNGAVYTNIVEWRYDCYVWALEKLNFSDIKVSVSMMGWATDGYPGANATNAERFFKHLLPWVTGNKGTPKRPGAPIDTDIHSLTDETKMNSGPFTRHWGIYRSNGQPKYKIDLTGQGRDIYPTTVRGIMRMPSRWCVFSGDRRDIFKVRAQLEWACSKSDCTSTLIGGSCSRLTFDQNVTYAFNMYFQFHFQDEEACHFDGLGRVAITDPSTEECVFPVEVVKGQQVNFAVNMAPPSLIGEGFRLRRPSLALHVVWVTILVEFILFWFQSVCGRFCYF
ncbi:glucan endo-1,3-beta-glucosidase 8-like [Salvia miltiorrhiza]|uniref:glucan endo-1,3-beta-glucosidase 8-like n=1 Tax=Salvia miltiorrhiza TaxID=226208 RepID=UPI0025AC5B89|nr:glucan endo-1,3-beta-glucosidase 8-like [Salvia miltiorrhiza]